MSAAIVPQLFTKTDTLYQPKKQLNEFSLNEQTQAVSQYWPAELQHILAISIRPARYARLIDNAGPLAKFISKVPSVNGEELGSLEQLQEKKIYEPINKWNPLTRGQIGCFLSHRNAWKHIVEENLQHALILEDDCDLTPHPETLKYIHQVFTEELNFQWDLVYLGRNPALCDNLKRIRPHVVITGKTWGLFSYAVTLAGAKKLLQSTAGPIQQTIDVLVSLVPEPKRKVGISPMALLIRTEEISDTATIK